jgi:hypothetical protein
MCNMECGMWDMITNMNMNMILCYTVLSLIAAMVGIL